VSVFEHRKNIDQYTDQRHNRLSSEDLDPLRIYVYTFHPSFISSLFGSFNGFLQMLRSYVLYLMQNRYNKSINVMYSKTSDGTSFSIDIDFWRDSDPDSSHIASVCIYNNGDVLYKYGYIDIDEIRDTIRRLGSMAYSIAFALIETLSNDPRCVLHICGDYLDWLQKQLSSIVYFPIPDPEVYESVKNLVNGGGMPFESSVDIDENIYRELKEKHKTLEYIDTFIPIDPYIQRVLGQYKYTVDNGVISYININQLINGITIIFEVQPSNIIETSLWIDPDKPKIYININTEFAYDINRVADVIRNWYDHVSKAIVNAIKRIENLDNIDRDTSKNYLETWLKVITIYRNDIENKKTYS